MGEETAVEAATGHPPADMLFRMVRALERIAEAMERDAGRLPPEALGKEAAADFLGVDVATVEHLIRTRKLAYVQHGSQRGRVVPVAALRDFLAEFRQATGAELATGRRKPR